jgi:GNAT superfamily N-acetyltransferase
VARNDHNSSTNQTNVTDGFRGASNGFKEIVFREVPASHADAIQTMNRYLAELDSRFDAGFDPGDTLTSDAQSMTAPNGALVVAYHRSDAIACGGVKSLDTQMAEIKRMWVDPRWRGKGLGAQLLATLESHALRLGHRVVRLDTNTALLEAITMYKRYSYTSIERYNDNPYAKHWFEKVLLNHHGTTT